MSTANKIFPGAARVYTEVALGGPCVEQESNPTIGATVATVAPNNPDRVGLTIINLGVNDLFIALNNGVSAANGIKIAASGGNIAMSVRDDFTLPAREWDGICPGGNSSIYVLEEVRQIYTPAGE